MNSNALAAAVQLGAATGLRSFTGAAVYARRLARNPRGRKTHDAIRHLLSTEPTARTLEVAALLELAADKLPFVPDRISPGPLLWRAAVGGLLGYAAAGPRSEGRVPIAIIGATSAVGAAFAGYATRRFLTGRGAPDWNVALTEDAVAIAIALRGARAGGYSGRENR